MTLERRHYVRKNPEDRFLYFRINSLLWPRPLPVSLPLWKLPCHLCVTYGTTQETVLAGVLVGNEGVVLEQCEGLHPFSFRISTGLRFSSAHGGSWETFSSTSGTEEKDQDNQFPEIEKINPQYDHHQRRFRKRSIACCPKWVCR